MAILFNDGLNIQAPKAAEGRSGKFESGAWRAYSSISEANTTINPAYRHKGLTVTVNVGGISVEYIYRDGITDNHLIPKGNIRIVGTGSDMTSSLNTLLATSGVSSITVGTSQSTSVIVNGTLNVGSKHIIFEHGSYIQGSGTIVGGIISASPFSNILDTSLTLSGVRTSDNTFWCEWFGAVGDNSTNNIGAIQKAATYVCNNDVGCKNLRIGAGIFRITKGINFFRDTNGNGDPEFVNFTFKGNLGGYEHTGNETVIRCMHFNNFAINIQKGKGCVVSDMAIEGQNTLNYNADQAWSTGSYVLSGIRDNNQSPYAGLVLDAFGASTTGSDRYPGFESFYANVVGNGGSTDCKFYNISINGFVVGVILSPNGNTQNNEAHTFDGLWFANLKDGFVTTNSQERTVRCINFKFWNSTQTCCRTIGYGANRGEVPQIESWNIAGNIYQLFFFSGVGGYFPVISVNKFYAENLYWIGYIGGVTVKFTDCHFALTDIKSTAPSLKIQDFVFAGANAHFDNCIIITYNGGEKVPYNLVGRVKFINCFLTTPFACSSQDWTYDMYQIEYDNCRFYCDPGFLSTGSFESKGQGYYSMTYDSQLEIATFNKEYTSYKSGTYDLNSAYYFAQYRRVKSPAIRKIPFGNAINVTVTGNTATLGAMTHTPPANSIIYARNLTFNNGYSVASGYAVMRYTGGSNCDRVIKSLTTGTYDLYYISINYLNPIGFCDISGTNVTNVIMERSITPFDIGTGLKNISNLIQTVTASAAGTATLSYNNNLGSATECVISNYEYDEFGSSYCNPLVNPFVENGVAFTTGAYYKNLKGVGSSRPAGAENAAGWLCVRSGVKGSPVPPIFIEQSNDGSY